MSSYQFDQQQVAQQIVRNLVEIGQVHPDHVAGALRACYDLDPKDLMAVLLESHMLRELVEKPVAMVIFSNFSTN